jgi:hypothetical protein
MRKLFTGSFQSKIDQPRLPDLGIAALILAIRCYLV